MMDKTLVGDNGMGSRPDNEQLEAIQRIQMLKNVGEFLHGVAPLELENGIPQPTSSTTLRLWFKINSQDIDLRSVGLLPLPTPISASFSAVVISSAHFTITYDTEGVNRVTERIARQALTDLENALTQFNQYFRFSATPMTQVHFDAPAGKSHYTDPATGIHFLADAFRQRENNPAARTAITVHECFHVWQFSHGWTLTTPQDGQLIWVLEGTATWASLKWSGPSPSVESPNNLTYWFSRQQDIQITRASEPARGYVTLPFWLWFEETYPAALTSFLTSGRPAGSTLVVDALARAVYPRKTFEELVCEFGCGLVNNTWCPYRQIQDVEQPIPQTILPPVFVPSTDPEYTNQLLEQGNTWCSGHDMYGARMYIYKVQYRLCNADPSKTWIGSLSFTKLSGADGVVAYFAAGSRPTGAFPQRQVPFSNVFQPAANVDAYIISCANQHPPGSSAAVFSIRFIASFVGT